MSRKRAHPPWCSYGAPRPAPDNLTEAGANDLARKIRAAWLAVGHDVPVVVEKVALSVDRHVWAPRMPTLVNGLPRRAPATETSHD